MNEYQLKIIGAAELGQQIDTTKSLRVGFDCTVYSVEKLDNQDGTFKIRYKAKIDGAIDVMQGDKIFKGKDRSKKSQQMRWRLEAKAVELGLDPKIYYEEQMNILISQI